MHVFLKVQASSPHCAGMHKSQYTGTAQCTAAAAGTGAVLEA
jgi:hypothetical protein